MIKVGITGQSGFIGTHLYNYLNLKKEEVSLVTFQDDYFNKKEQFLRFVSHCDVVVHLAAMNRHGDPQVIYNTNILLVNQLIDACKNSDSKPHIIFASSSQEERSNPYGKSKLEGRKLFEKWAKANNASFTGLIIPNVFGPFGNPFYNSVVATFCYQLTHNEEPKIEIDGTLKLIYVGELTDIIYKCIVDKNWGQKTEIRGGEGEMGRGGDVCTYGIPYSTKRKVSEILEILKGFKSQYFEKGIFPNLDDQFEKDLFNTFVCYIDHENFFPFFLDKKQDERGVYVETIKMNSGGQVSFSTTKPGITRGNHYHTRKAERFAVIKGKARIQLRRIGTDRMFEFELDGNRPSFVDMPVWHTHNITNIGEEELFTLFWTNEHFDPEDPDTFIEKVD